MDFRQLRYFIVIAESASLSEAARKVHVVQPALSRRLSDLEKELGVQLIVRGRLGIALTAAGTELYKRSRLIMKQIDSATQAVKERVGVIEGPIAIGLLRPVAPAIAGKLYYAIRERLPGVVPLIRVGYSADLLELLRAGQLDIAMQVLSHASNSVKPVYSERLCLVGTPQLVGKGKSLVRLKDAARLPLLLSSRQAAHSLVLELADAKHVPLDVIGAIEDTSALIDVCATGQAATVLSEWVVMRTDMRRGLTARFFKEPELARRVVLCVNEDVPRTGKVIVAEALISQLLEELASAARTTYLDRL